MCHLAVWPRRGGHPFAEWSPPQAGREPGPVGSRACLKGMDMDRGWVDAQSQTGGRPQGCKQGRMQNEITAGPGNPQAKSQGILPEGSSEKENPLRTRGVGGQVQAGSVRRGAWSRLLCAVTAWRARGSEGGHIDSPGTFIERPKPPHPRPLESDFLEVGFQYEKDLSKTLYRPRMGKWAQGGE